MKYLIAILLAFGFTGCVSREKYFHDLKIMALDEANFRDRVGELEKRVREIERKVDLDAESRGKRSEPYVVYKSSHEFRPWLLKQQFRINLE